MIQVSGNNILRAGTKIGMVVNNVIYDHVGNKLAHVVGNAAYDMAGHKLAYIEGEYVILVAPGNNTKVRIEDDNKVVEGVVSDIVRAAIRIVLG